MTMIKVPCGSASAAQLRYFAEQVLGLEGISKHMSAAILLGKIQAAAPDLSEIDVPEEMALASDAKPAAEVKAAEVKNIPAGRAGLHFQFDPKVVITVLPTNDAARSKRCFVSCNGDVVEIQRGKQVELSYRFFLVLKDAVELRPVETGEINPTTNMPLVEMVEQPAYPFTVHAMPSPEEIAAWENRTADAAL